VYPPQNTAARERKRLDGLWRFTLDPAGEGRAARWFSDLFPDAREMPRGWDGRRIVLHFEPTTHRATVWVGDTEVALRDRNGHQVAEGNAP
jgi:beta-glucuronidase